MHPHSRKFIALNFNFVLSCFFVFPQPTEYGAEGFFLRRCPDVGVGRGTPGGSESCDLPGVCPIDAPPLPQGGN